jgi:signal transduction histidine kinase
VKFTEEGSVRIKSYIADATLTITVTDTGMGIHPSQLPNIWESFKRGSDYGTRSTQGVGLGLSITHALVTKMQGKADVKSTVGQGSEFTISLPLENKNEAN